MIDDSDREDAIARYVQRLSKRGNAMPPDGYIPIGSGVSISAILIGPSTKDVNEFYNGLEVKDHELRSKLTAIWFQAQMDAAVERASQADNSVPSVRLHTFRPE
jgi:hypothetical protein